jgi:hypothetical protein
LDAFLYEEKGGASASYDNQAPASILFLKANKQEI